MEKLSGGTKRCSSGLTPAETDFSGDISAAAAGEGWMVRRHIGRRQSWMLISLAPKRACSEADRRESGDGRGQRPREREKTRGSGERK